MSPLKRAATQYRQLKVSIPRARPLPSNPHTGLSRDTMSSALLPPLYPVETDSECPHEARVDSVLRHKLLACDQRSFLTGSVVADIEPAHILAPVRNDKVRKDEVEKFLTQQRFHHPKSGRFILDSVENSILLESNLYIQWRDYATFCFVPAEADAKAMLTSLRKSNTLWQEKVDCNPGKAIIRPLDMSQSPFNQPRWDVLLLYPHALLPDNQGLLISQRRTFYTPGETLHGDPAEWTFWWPYMNSLTRPTNNGRRDYLPPFVAQDVRAAFGEPPISSLAMIVNAQNKVQQFVDDLHASRGLYLSVIPPRIGRYADLLSDLVETIFFVPDGVDSVADSSRVEKAFRDDLDHSNVTGAFVDLLWKNVNDPYIRRLGTLQHVRQGATFVTCIILH
ncbi:hypothetical protein BDN70DRAFT_929026 [Pholiota conissans]|uniref:Uncharacterized protein n=1 Tax=Pholiota conissans TaxID=109636 RepID=A0A9P5ZA09_9AGAR|nr:hypothetical protein BDN70DRAFT_929026 [Pholiota conissans]